MVLLTIIAIWCLSALAFGVLWIWCGHKSRQLSNAHNRNAWHRQVDSVRQHLVDLQPTQRGWFRLG